MTERPPRQRVPLLELLLIFGLPLAALLAGALLLDTARHQGFTPVENGVAAPKGS